MRLPIDKVKKCGEEIQAVCHRNKITLHGIQSLLGLLNFACAVILPGRPFLRRLTDLTIGIRSPKHYIRITNNVKSDLNMWLEFLSAFNGKVLFLDKAVPLITLAFLQMHPDPKVLVQCLEHNGSKGAGQSGG